MGRNLAGINFLFMKGVAMFTGQELGSFVLDIFTKHEQFPREPSKAFRKFDGKTPYGVHPTFLAMLFLHEESLPEYFRVWGAKALLAHDLLEDTTVTLPKWCSPVVQTLVKELTFAENEDHRVEIWKRSPQAILLKFYDVVGNLMCVKGMLPEYVEFRRESARKHLEWVEGKYPQLEIVKIAKGLLA